MRVRLLIALFLGLFALPIMAQQATDGDDPVTVPKKYVSPEGLNHQIEAKTSEWAGVGKEIGEATKEGLNSVVDASEKFGASKVGTFVMVMIAWKIMAHDIIGIILGVPLLIGGLCFWWAIMKRFLWGYQVLDRKEGRTKFYKRQEPYAFESGDARTCLGAFGDMGLLIFVGVMLGVVIF